MKNVILLLWLILTVIGVSYLYFHSGNNSGKNLKAARRTNKQKVKKEEPKSAPPQKIIVIQPYEAFPVNLIKEAEKGITNLYILKVNILNSVLLPNKAYYKAGKRYKAHLLLVDLDNKRPLGAFKIIGLTTKDISTTNGEDDDWGIFGLGGLDGKSCVVSTFRLKNAVSEKLLIARLTKVINHEIGHTLGLDHCPTLNCLMQDAGGSIKTVDRETGLMCSSCSKKIDKYLVH